MIIPKEEFDKFKKYFKEYQTLLNLNDWQIFFMQDKLKDKFAKLIIDSRSKSASVVLTNEIPDHLSKNGNWKGVKMIALHETLHLLLTNVIQLGAENISERDLKLLKMYEESVIRVLEKVIK